MKVKYATIIVRDMEESVKFYREILGFETDSVYNLGPGIMITLMKSGGETMVELIQNKEDKCGLHCIGFEVDHISAVVQDYRQRGVRIIMEPRPITNGSLAFIEDPNGARIALIQHDKN